MDIGVAGFFGYLATVWFVPRLAIAIFFFAHAGGNYWAIVLGVLSLITINEGAVRRRFLDLGSAILHLVTGRPFIIEKTVTVEKVVEKVVERVVEKTVVVEKPVNVNRIQISVRDMSVRDARLCLGVPDDASAQDINARYHDMLKLVHPDRGGSMMLAAIVNRAKTVLAPKKRLQ